MKARVGAPPPCVLMELMEEVDNSSIRTTSRVDLDFLAKAVLGISGLGLVLMAVYMTCNNARGGRRRKVKEEEGVTYV
jgi:hypothetical protein